MSRINAQKLFALPSVLLLAGIAAGQSYTISTFAGNGLPPSPMPAKDAPVWPRSVVLDQAGNLYFNSGHAVFKMDRLGILTRVAGVRGAGPAGDGGPATSAHLDSPNGVAVDSAGDVYIADPADHRIRRVNGRGIITTVAGNGTKGYSGDGGPAIRASLDAPNGIVVDDSRNLYIADFGNNRVRKVTTDGIIRTIAGNGKSGHAGDHGLAIDAQLDGPTDVAIDPAGNLYIADSHNHRVRKVTSRGGILTIAGRGIKGYSGDRGLATAAELDLPQGIATDSEGSLYIADYGNNAIRKVTARGIISTVVPADGSVHYSGHSGIATETEILRPSGIAAGLRGELYIADASMHVRKVDRNGMISRVAGNGQFGFFGDGGPAIDSQLQGPWSLAFDSGGNLCFSDFFNHRVRKISPNGRIVTVAGNGESGYTKGQVSPSALTTPLSPWGVAVDSAGNLYIADSFDMCIRKVAPNGAVSTVERGVAGAALAVDRAGNLYTPERNRVLKITPKGLISTIAGTGSPGYSGDGGSAISAELNQPWGIALDAEGNLYIADSLNGRIRKVNTNGIISTVAGNGKRGSLSSDHGVSATDVMLNGPQGVAVDSAGNLFLTDSNYVVIRKVDRNGVISTIAGNGTFGYSGDGGPATKAQFSDPGAIAVGRDGRIYVADYRNDCIRVLTPSGR